MPDSWPDRIVAIRDALLVLEINTIVSDELSAQKMPEVPLALHTLVQAYSNYLAAAGYQLTRNLLAKATVRAGGVGGAATQAGGNEVLLQLQFWPFPGRVWTTAERLAQRNIGPPPQDDDSPPATELTNGAETFEALQWAAWGAVQHARAGGGFPRPTEPSILARINANCRQIKEAAMRLEQQNSSPKAAQRRLAGLVPNAAQSDPNQPAQPAQAGQATASLPMPGLFGATVEETARSLFEHPRPNFICDPDVTILIRKAWDLGTDQVCMQTVMQVDGDIVQILGKMKPEEQAFLTTLHRDAVKDSVGQWRALFDVLAQAAKSFLGALRGAA